MRRNFALPTYRLRANTFTSRALTEMGRMFGLVAMTLRSSMSSCSEASTLVMLTTRTFCNGRVIAVSNVTAPPISISARNTAITQPPLRDKHPRRRWS